MKMWQIIIFSIVFVTMSTSPAGAVVIENGLSPVSFSITILPWKTVNSIIPRKSIFTIIDVETGLSFKVQRRAGSNHADVQPLTHEDTKVMKKIYGGKWSWNRRAILILTGDQLLSASMHGMPHGAGALKNGFPGHFCVHFFGSTTHRSENEDFAHKLMILRAAGKLNGFLTTISPTEIIKVFEIAVNQKDPQLLDLIVRESQNTDILFNQLREIEMIHFDQAALSITDDTIKDKLVIHMKVNASIYKSDHNQIKKKVNFILWKDLMSGQWMINEKIDI
jgi:hypothetical protein